MPASDWNTGASAPYVLFCGASNRIRICVLFSVMLTDSIASFSSNFVCEPTAGFSFLKTILSLFNISLTVRIGTLLNCKTKSHPVIVARLICLAVLLTSRRTSVHFTLIPSGKITGASHSVPLYRSSPKVKSVHLYCLPSLSYILVLVCLEGMVLRPK